MNLKDISEIIKKSLEGITEKEMFNSMEKHYKTLHLINENGQWIDSEFQKYSSILLPNDMSNSKINLFVDQIEKTLFQNNYFMFFIDSIKQKQYGTLKKKFDEESAVIIPDIIAYSLVLENLTRAIVENNVLLESIYNNFRKARKASNSFKLLPLFHKIKLLSVEKPIEQYIRYHTTRLIPPKSGRMGVSINIWEATWTDWKSQNKNNAKAGKVLAQNKAGSLKKDPLTGAGPSEWSDDGRIPLRSFPFALEWTDLYQTWNMAFVTRFQDFPYILPKLLIPIVADYKNTPKEYIYKRAIALYIYLNFASFSMANHKSMNIKPINWFDKELNKDWGYCNAKSAEDYLKKISDVKKN